VPVLIGAGQNPPRAARIVETPFDEYAALAEAEAETGSGCASVGVESIRCFVYAHGDHMVLATDALAGHRRPGDESSRPLTKGTRARLTTPP
jgi:hypothetical protein